jgi:hypothetical protein
VLVLLPDITTVSWLFLVVVATHQEVDSIIPDEIDEPVLLCDASRPDVGTEMFERLRFANSGKWIAYRGFEQVRYTQSYAPVRIDPVSKIFSKLVLKNWPPPPA